MQVGIKEWNVWEYAAARWMQQKYAAAHWMQRRSTVCHAQTTKYKKKIKMTCV